MCRRLEGITLAGFRLERRRRHRDGILWCVRVCEVNRKLAPLILGNMTTDTDDLPSFTASQLELARAKDFVRFCALLTKYAGDPNAVASRDPQLSRVLSAVVASGVVQESRDRSRGRRSIATWAAPLANFNRW